MYNDIYELMQQKRSFSIVMEYSYYKEQFLVEATRDLLSENYGYSSRIKLEQTFAKNYLDKPNAAKTFGRLLFKFLDIKMSPIVKAKLGTIFTEASKGDLVLLEFAILDPEKPRAYYFNDRSCLWNSAYHANIPYTYRDLGVYAVCSHRLSRKDHEDTPRNEIRIDETREDFTIECITGRVFMYPKDDMLYVFNHYGEFLSNDFLDAMGNIGDFGFVKRDWGFDVSHSGYRYLQTPMLITKDGGMPDIVRNILINDETVPRANEYMEHLDGYYKCRVCGRVHNEYHGTMLDKVHYLKPFVCEDCNQKIAIVESGNGGYILKKDAVKVKCGSNTAFFHKTYAKNSPLILPCDCCGDLMRSSGPTVASGDTTRYSLHYCHDCLKKEAFVCKKCGRYTVNENKCEDSTCKVCADLKADPL